jgi:hypothetical protein
MISVARCRELADHYKALSQKPSNSPNRARSLKNIAYSFAGVAGQLERFSDLVRDEQNSARLASSNSGKEVSAGRGEAHKRAALVHHQPTALDRFHAGAIFGRARLVVGQERPVDLFDVDPAALQARSYWQFRAAAARLSQDQRRGRGSVNFIR